MSKNIKNNQSVNKMERFLNERTSPEEALQILEEAAFNPEMEKVSVLARIQSYTQNLIENFGYFIPAGSFAADDGQGLCDLQCEAFILKREGVNVEDDLLAEESKNNYWLRDGVGTPLFKMGKLLERKGFLVNRFIGASLEKLKKDLEDFSIIVVVNEDTLSGKHHDIFDEDFNTDSNPNHAIVVLSINENNQTVTLFNPSRKEDSVDYPVDTFLSAWGESGNYEVTVRKKRFPEEYNPQPYDVSRVVLSEELEELIEMICENAHDVWAKEKIARNPGIGYSPLDPEGKEVPGKNHFLVPYDMLSEEDKEFDRNMVLNSFKLAQRLGFRIVSFNGMYKCPHCGTAVEPSDCFCRACGERLTWETFR